MSSWLAIHTSLHDKLASPVQHETIAETGPYKQHVRTTTNNMVRRRLNLGGVSHVHTAHVWPLPARLLYSTLPRASWQDAQITSYSKRMPVTIRPFDRYPGERGS